MVSLRDERSCLNILEVLREPFHLKGHELQITPSIGAVLAAPGDNARALVEKADVTMYRVKATGKDGYQLFDDHW